MIYLLTIQGQFCIGVTYSGGINITENISEYICQHETFVSDYRYWCKIFSKELMMKYIIEFTYDIFLNLRR